MKTAIYASLMHCSSTDKKPMHGKCPEGESSWCFYKRAIAKGEKGHTVPYLSPQVVEKIMPVYQRLASDTILERCVAGKTQNSMKVCIAAFGENAQKSGKLRAYGTEDHGFCPSGFATTSYRLKNVYLQVDDHVHPGNCPAAVSSEKKNKTFFIWGFTITRQSWAMNEQISYFSSFSDEWSRDLKSVQVQKQRSCRERLKRNLTKLSPQFASRLTSMWLYYCKLRGTGKMILLVNQLIVADKMFEMVDSETVTHIGVFQGRMVQTQGLGQTM
ncbi:uncharacterized protein TNCV_3687911 [Trichonephila clavipes]|nr:uncharacterized protein TNCV_3687911 [Trichonephila clavipes]